MLGRYSTVLAIDPGTLQSAYVVYRHDNIIDHGTMRNEALLDALLSEHLSADMLVLEMVASYGMPVGAEVFETCVWIGRFLQGWPGQSSRMFRREVKLHICGSPRANDATIRQALLDRFGAPGTKKAPGATYGLKADEWQALALAVTWVDERWHRHGAPDQR